MASGSDVRDILALPARQAPAVTSKGPPKARAKRLDGITRELYALMGDNAPALTLARPMMRDRPKFRAPAARWIKRDFTSSARGDGLRLKHWEKETEEQPADYPYVKFNTTSNPLSYTSEEYTDRLQVDGWSREETDFLFDLCHQFDLRFIVIADRWDESGHPDRTIEDLKERYYDCCRKLILARPTEEEAARAQLAQTYAFDKTREVSRKEYLRSLIKRTPAQIDEELFLYTESRRLEQEYTTISREREDLLRSLAGPGNLMQLPANMVTIGPTGNIQAAGQAPGNLPFDRKRRRDEDAAASGGGKKPKTNPAYDAEHCITRFNGPSGPPGVSLRSQRLIQLKPIHAPLVRDVLTEMGISQRLVMPTHQNAERLEALVVAVANLAELKRHLDRIEYEVGVSQARNEGLVPAVNQEEREKTAEGSAAEDEEAMGTAADESTTGSRKRSASLSSVDTNRSNRSSKPPANKKARR